MRYTKKNLKNKTKEQLIQIILNFTKINKENFSYLTSTATIIADSSQGMRRGE